MAKTRVTCGILICNRRKFSSDEKNSFWFEKRSVLSDRRTRLRDLRIGQRQVARLSNALLPLR